MEEEGIDPFSVNRNPQIIKAAQQQIATMDVLVCGVCHSVFHFIEEFQEHKSKNECGLPAFKGNLTETKPQVWAFLLWKSSRAKTENEGADQVTSWKLYQKWCKMPENIRESWVCAGKAIQVSTTLASAKMQEVKAVGKIQVVNKTKNEKDTKDNLGNDIKKDGVVRKLTNIRGKPGRPPQSIGQDEKGKEISESGEGKKEEKDVNASVENGGGDAGLLTDTVEIKEEQVSEADVEDHATFEEEDEEEELRRSRLEQGESIEDIDRSVHRPPPSQLQTVEKSQGDIGVSQGTDESGNVVRRKGKDGEKRNSESEDEYVVERIVSRRYNIRKKAFEYLLKWEGYPDDQNTWEPAENLADCKHLLENFERNLAKQKVQQQPRGPSGLPSGPKMITATPDQRGMRAIGTPLGTPRSVGRPVRSSKKKAMDQVKAWCGSMYTKKMEDDERQGSSEGSEDEDGNRKVKNLSESEDASQADGNLSDDLSRKRKQEDDPFRKGPGRPRKIIKVNGMPSAPGKTIVASSNQELAKAIGEFITGFDTGSGDKKTSPVILGKKDAGGNVTVSSTQQPVLVANSKGVVKVDARSMPNLASGVYIMSKSSSGSPSTGLIKVDSSSVASPTTPNVKVVTGPGQKQGGILAMKDAKTGATVNSPTSNSPPLASSPPKTILGPKKPTVLGAAPSPVTPMKLLPKLVSPQIRGGGLVRVPQTNRPTVSSPAPRPLVAPSARMPLTPRPSLVSPQAQSSAGKGIRPLKPKQTYSVAGGKVSSLPLSAGMKSGIRPIEAMLGGTSTPTTPTRTILGKKGTPAVSITVKEDSGEAGKTPKTEGTPVRGAPANRGRAKGGRILVGESKGAEDKTKPSGDGIHMEFTEERNSDTESESDCGLPDDFPTGDLPPIEPASPPRPLTLCPLTGKILARAEGEKTPPPSPPPAVCEPTVQAGAILTDEGDGEGEETLIKVEMSPGGTTGTVVSDGAPLLRTEAGLTVKRLLAGGGGQGNAANILSTVTQLGGQVQGISLPARKLFTEDGTEIVESDAEMVTIQGEDGVVYHVQGELEDGTQTLLVQGEDGEQRCVYVTTNEGVEGEDGSTVLAFGDPAYADAVAQLDASQVSALTEGGSQILLQGEDGTTFSETQLMSVMEGEKDDGQAQIVAQVLEAGQPQPGGGPRKVVLLLPDGNMMMTEVDEEQYAALELDK